MKPTSIVRNSLCALIVLSATFVSSIRAAEIADVQVKNQAGNNYPIQNVLPHINSQPGTTFRQETLTKDIQRLYKTGFFRDIGADVKQTAEGKIRLHFIVEPVPRFF
ncbi:MAG: POTRA domain-containing protein [Lentisphaeria bacterium]